MRLWEGHEKKFSRGLFSKNAHKQTASQTASQMASQTGLFWIQKSKKIKIAFRSSAKQLVVHIPHIRTKHGIVALCLAELV